MTTTMRSGGLQHAASLGNLEASSRANTLQSTRSCESDDENMGRKSARPHYSGQFPKTSVYSKGDIREQYCLTDKQLQNSIERPRRERFFGCWSGRTAPQSFLGVCVGRRAPSDENLADYAPIHRYPRYPHSVTGTDELFQYDEDIESSYFRRRPTSFLSGGDPKRYTWMPADEEAVRLEGPRPICPDLDDMSRGPYVVGSYPPKFFSQSTEQLAGLYRCPAHVGLPPPPPPPSVPPDGLGGGGPPRQKHVSFARSHTLTSFDEAMGIRPITRLAAARSQERLIGGKKPIITTGGPPIIQQAQVIQPILQQQHQIIQMQQQQLLQQQQQQQQQQQHAVAQAQHAVAQQLAQQQQQQEIMVVEKVKRGVMKTQATQTEGCLARKAPPHHLSLSPRTIHRVKMVSQGAQTNGGVNGRKLTKSLSEVGGGRGAGVGAESTSPIEENKMFDHELLHRTQSEEPPRSPFEMTPPALRSHPIVHHPSDSYSRTSSRLSQIETSRSEPLSSENILTHSRNSSYQSQDSAVSFRSTDISASRASADSLPYENILPRRSSTVTPIDIHCGSSMKKEIEPSIHRHDGGGGVGGSGDFSYAYESHSLPRRTCIHHRKEEYHTHSLPRRDIYHHADGHEMPLQHHPPPEGTKLEGILRKDHRRESFSRDSSVDSTTPTFRKTPTFQENHIPLRRASCAIVQPETHTTTPRRSSVQPQHMQQSSEELCSTCDSESDSKGEKEILIDFKPRISPTPSPKSQRKKKLQKTLSEGEILVENRRKENAVLLASASDEDLTTPENEPKNKYIYRDLPIKDEGIFHKQKLLPLPPHNNEHGPPNRRLRDKFRKRSISLEETFLDDDDDTLDHTIERVPLPPRRIENGIIKSTPPSPSNHDELSVLQPTHSLFPSTDSLANDLTRDHSDGIWNESQATVLHAEQSPPELSGPGNLLTPTSRRKNLLLQHQQRSSMDTEALDFEDLLLDQLPPPPPPSSSHVLVVSTGVQTTASAMTQTCSSVLSTTTKSIATLQTTTTAIATVLPTPHIAVTPSLSIDENTEQEVPMSKLSNRRSRPLSPSRKKELRKTSATYQSDIEPLVHSRRPSESPDPNSIAIATGLTDHATSVVIRSGDLGKNNTDISECSTNTDDYITCTDNSKRGGGSGTSGTGGQGTKTTTTSTAPSSSSTQVPVSAQTSQTVTQDGSSFESASSMYSLARGDAILCEDISQVEEMPLPAIPKPKSIKMEPSPTHSVSSSSSGSYNLTDKARQKISPTARTTLPKLKSSLQKKKKSESITDDDHDDDDDEDDKSEKRYSSSGYYESPHEEGEMKTVRIRKTTKEWSEDERRRKKGNFKLEFEKNGSKVLTPSPSSAKTSIAFKQISPEDRTAMNILDGTSPSKSGRRFRPKTKRSPRLRSSIASGDDLLPRRGSKTSLIKSPDHQQQQQPSPIIHTTTVPHQQITLPVQASPASTKKLSPSKYQLQKLKSHSPGSSPRKICNMKTKELSPEKRLKAMSTESLRSVSPGSDSVFYSEADVISDHQVHQCHHCGKEVEIVAAVCGSQDSIGEIEDERSNNIVQPPAGFADSPDAVRQPTRLYKKLDKRFRSEERHTDRRHYRSRPDTRAKSEERGGKEEAPPPTGTLRPAGSSPCVIPPEEVSPSSFTTRDQQADPEQGIYHGYFRLGIWICITDRDVWRRNDIQTQMEVRFAEPATAVPTAPTPVHRRGSTDSEKDFRKKYQAITHRLVHRKSCGEMYRRQSTNSFTARALISPTETPETLRHRLEEILRLMFVVWTKTGQANKTISGVPNDTDKTIVVRRESGEFGFRIHGSKPVVVSAIEPDTPAETSGLEIGDIVISVNGISVVDKSHSEVVKIAHAGSDTLELEVARTIGILSPNGTDSSVPALYSGYLWRQGGQVSGNANTTKWVRRWFSLRPDHCLYFYKTDSDTQPVGAVLLTNHTVEMCSTDIGKSFAFSIEGSETPTLYLAADTDEAANRWVAVMSHAAKQADPWLEVSTRNLRLPPNGVPKPDCFGYLMKLGSKWRAWSKRYCVLKDACLYFYHDGNSKNAFGMACLQGYRVQPTSTAGGRKFAFEVTPPEPKLRHYYFSTESDMDKRRWVAALEYSIDRWMKAG